MKVLACVLFLLPVLVQADERLWGTWRGIDPEDDAVFMFTFAEDGVFEMGSPYFDEENTLIEELFGEMFFEIDLSLDELVELGFEPPTLKSATFIGRWETDGDNIKVWMSTALIEVEGEPPVRIQDFMVDVLTDIASLPLDEEVIALVDMLIALTPIAFEVTEGDEELLIEGTFYFLDDQLIVTDEFGDPLILSRIEDSETAVRSATWGQIKSGGW